MSNIIDREARATAASQIRLVIAEPNANALDKALAAKTKDKAVRAVLNRANSVVKRAASLTPDGQDLRLFDDEKRQLEYYVLFLESDCEMPGMCTSLQNRDVAIAAVAFVAVFGAFVAGLWVISHDFWGSVWAGSVFAAFTYAVGMLGVMIASTAKLARKSLIRLRPMGVRFLWPFASLSDLSQTLDGKSSASVESTTEG